MTDLTIPFLLKLFYYYLKTNSFFISSNLTDGKLIAALEIVKFDHEE